METIIDILKAFLVGGLICTIGQLLLDFTKLTMGKILVLFVVVGVVLGAVGVYEPLAEWAGAGATVPLTGFGYALAKGTRDAVAQQGLYGVLSGPISSSAIGIMAAILFGLIASVFSKPKEK